MAQLWHRVLMLTVCRGPSGVTTTCHSCRGAQRGEKQQHCHSQWAERLAPVMFGHQAGSECYQEWGGGGGVAKGGRTEGWGEKEVGRFINNQHCVTATASPAAGL